MQTQRTTTTNTVDQIQSATHRNKFNIPKINYQHITRKPPVYATCNNKSRLEYRQTTAGLPRLPKQNASDEPILPCPYLPFPFLPPFPSPFLPSLRSRTS